MIKLRLPRTLLGWRRVFWVTIWRCPECKSPLVEDCWLFGDTTRYCMPCGGGMYPGGFWRMLASNWRAAKQAAEKSAEAQSPKSSGGPSTEDGK